MYKPAIEVWLGTRLQITAFLTGHRITIGRSPENDVVLDNISVSRLHAEVEVEGTEIRVVDHGSANGTRVNDALVEGKQQIRVGDYIKIGKYRLKLVMGDTGGPGGSSRTDASAGPGTESATFDLRDPEVAEARRRLRAEVEEGRGPSTPADPRTPLEPVTPAEPYHPDAPTPAMPTSPGGGGGNASLEETALEGLDVPGGRPPGLGLPLVPNLQVTEDGALRFHKRLDEDAVRIGRAPDNDLVLRGEDVSRYHAVVAREGTRHVVEDLGSSNGVFVNKKRVERAPLASGDAIRIGRYEIVYARMDPGVLGVRSKMAAARAVTESFDPDSAAGDTVLWRLTQRRQGKGDGGDEPGSG